MKPENELSKTPPWVDVTEGIISVRKNEQANTFTYANTHVLLNIPDCALH